MIRVHNRLSQPLCIGEEIVPADGSKPFESSNADIERLEALGHIAVVSADAEQPSEDAGAKKSGKGEK